MTRDYERGKCEECGHRGRIWQFQKSKCGSLIWLCGKCQQVYRNTRKIKRKPR